MSHNPPALLRLQNIERKSRQRPILVIAVLLLALLASFFIRVLLGSYTVTLPDFFTIISGGTIESARGARFIVMEEKLPRAILGTLVGLTFGVSGAIFQLLLRNPLASPDVIGISSGASMGAVLAISFWGATGFTLSIFAIASALIIAGLILLLARGKDNIGNRFILMGIGVSALCNAVTSYFLARLSLNQATNATIWMTGSLGSATWERIKILSLALLLVLPVVLLYHRKLHLMALGEELAQGLGLNPNRTRWLFIIVGVLLAALASAAAGPVAFVAFVSGPIARNFLKGRHSLLAAALTGAIIINLADFLAAEIIPNGNLPLGIITGLLGAPILIWLLTKAQKEQSA